MFQFSLLVVVDLSTTSRNPITKFEDSSPFYSRCRYIARIIPDTRPSGSLRSRLVYIMALPAIFSRLAGEDDGLGCFCFFWGGGGVLCFFLPSSTTLAITLFSQPTERAGTHAGVWKQEFPPRRKGGVGGIPPTFARTRATDSSHTSHRLLGGVSRRRCPSHTTVIGR